MDGDVHAPLSSPTMIRYLAAAYLLTVVSCAPPFYPEGRKISEMEMIIEGRETVDGKRLRSMLKTQPGTRYAAGRLDDDIRTLYFSGYIDDMRFDAEPDGDEVRVIVTIDPKPGFGPLPFSGHRSFQTETLAREAGLKRDTPINPKTIEKARRNVEAFYHRQGYKDAKLTTKFHDPYEVDGQPGWMEDFYFIVEEGAKSP